MELPVDLEHGQTVHGPKLIGLVHSAEQEVNLECQGL